MTQPYTYLHCKPNGDPFYVGKGTGNRALRIVDKKRNSHHKNIVKKCGSQNILVYVFHCESEDQALADEIQQIAQLRLEGYELANISNGGEGTVGMVFTAEHRANIGAASKNRIPTEQTRAKLRAASAARKNKQPTLGKKLPPRSCSPETRAKISATKLLRGTKGPVGVKRSPETRLKISIASKAAWAKRQMRTI